MNHKADNLKLDARDQSSAIAQSSRAVAESQHAPSQTLLTIFAMPKPFGQSANTDRIQRNAIKSWLKLGPKVEVLLIGDEQGIAETATELGARHAGGVEFNKLGTPLVSSAFEIAKRETQSPILAYCNSDVILLKDFFNSAELLSENPELKKFVAFGRRTDLAVEREIDFEKADQVQSLLTESIQKGVDATNACKEYFIFNRELYDNIPRFAIGRGNWDNWMIHWAKQNQIPVVNLSSMVHAIHQAHDYTHTGAGRYECYVSGDEAQENMRLAGGRHLISGSTSNWRLTETGLRKENPVLLNPSFWRDVPRFMRLMLNLMTG